MNRDYWHGLLKKLEKVFLIVREQHFKFRSPKITIRVGRKTICELSKREIDDLFFLWKLKAIVFYDFEYPMSIRRDVNMVLDPRIRDRPFFVLKTCGNRRYAKNFFMLKHLVEYAGFKPVEPSDDLKEAFKKLNDDKHLALLLEIYDEGKRMNKGEKKVWKNTK